ncbi:Flp pilus assembly complex ATPase component TadA [Planctomycetales bacterium ZRK34]|nr:Flp pilus assembly complex ATPase component TadA [Planctomycetales bacterium ZRK34]
MITGYTENPTAPQPAADVPAAAASGAPASQAQQLADRLGLSWMPSLEDAKPNAQFVESIPISFARRHGVMGLDDIAEDRLPVAFSAAESWEILDVVARYLNRPVKPVVAPPEEITTAINNAYQQRQGQAQQFIDKLDRQDVLAEVGQLGQREDLLDVGTRAPVIKLVNLVLFEAVKLMASDVHIQPYEDRIAVRLRIDGVLADIFDLPKHLQEEIVSRIKVLSHMNIAEKRLAQDGRATVQVGQRHIDLRVSAIPTSLGERIVIRLLDKTAQLFALDQIGMQAGTLDKFLDLITVEHGLILVTGPTGSGKSTTMYAALQQINAKEKNILTLEDPIEYQLPGISQTQVSDRKGMTFASGLRSVLRQDPDIIMVGEIRDQETAVMAIQSALTGHLVFSSLHTNDAASAVTRLLDLGIEPYLVASSVVGVLAQRLVRRVCEHCAAPIDPNHADLRSLGIDPDHVDTSTMRRGAGCAVCRNTGYRRRIGLFELLTVDDSVQQLIQSRATASQVKHAAVAGGMKTLTDDGVEKMLAGRTTIEEVQRVVMRAEG